MFAIENLLNPFKIMKKTTLRAYIIICLITIVSFNFSAIAQAPGGVTNGLGFWIKADEGTNTTTDNGVITAWNDQSGNSISVSAISGTPIFQSDAANLFNFNPSIQVSSGYLQYPYVLPQNNFDQPAGDYFIGSVARNNGASEGTLVATEASQAYGLWLGNNGGFRRVWVATNTSSSTNILGSSSITGHAMFANERENISSGTQSPDLLYLNGAPVGSFTNGANISNNTAIRIGGGTYRLGTDLDGTIGETYIYNRALTDIEQQRIDSYLAIKYGITLDNGTNDYIASDGTTILWEVSNNTGYTNGIFGIGQDDGSALNQKVSRSVNNSNGPILATTQDFVSTNQDGGRTALGDGNFLMLGHNNATDNSFTSSFDGGANNRSDRVWKVDETGTVGNVYFAIPKSNYTFPTGTPSLVVSNDTTFNASDTIVSLSDDGTYFWAIINPTDNQYLVLASISTLTLEDKNILNFTLYPNPAKNVVNLKFNSATSSILDIRIYNILGSLILTERADVQSNIVTINIASLKSGVYFLNIKDKNKETSKKLIIE